MAVFKNEGDPFVIYWGIHDWMCNDQIRIGHGRSLFSDFGFADTGRADHKHRFMCLDGVTEQGGQLCRCDRGRVVHCVCNGW